MSSEIEFKQALSEVISALANMASNDVIPPRFEDAFKALQERRPEHFRYAATRPVEQLIEKTFLENLPNQKAKFIFKNIDFVMRHFKEYTSTFEGMPCSTDKARFCVNALARYLVDESEIEMNWDAEFTFHYPTTLKPYEILHFFDCIYNLYHGRYDGYVNFLGQKLQQKGVSGS